MKRSEMIQELTNDIVALRRYIGPVSEVELIERVLNYAEKLGMSPPEYLPEPKYCEVTGKQLECKPVRKWEQE
jgi:hypothetical protein